METLSVDVKTADGFADAFLAHPGDERKYPAVLFYMDAIGLRPRLREMAERIASSGYVVLVPNLFYRDGRAPMLDLPDLTKPENRQKMMESVRVFMQHFTPDLAMRDADGYVGFLAGLEVSDGGPMGVTGYCMGGALSLRTAARFPAVVSAAASFHGGRLATDAADSPHLLAGQIAADLYLAHADNDQSMPPEQIDRLEASLDAAGVRYQSELYVGAAHGFTMTDTSAYNEQATDRHWTELLGLLNRKLKPSG